MSSTPTLVTLEEIVVSGGLQTGPFGSQLRASEYREFGVPVVMPRDIRAGQIHDDSIARVSSEKARAMDRHALRAGDLLFARRGDLSKIAVVGPAQAGWLCGTGCLRARLDAHVATPEFVAQYAMLPRVLKWLESNALGQTMLNLNTEIVGSLPVVLPSRAEQRRITDVLSIWDMAIEKTRVLVRAKSSQRQSLSQRVIDQPWAAGAWPMVRLGAICRPVGRRNVDGATRVLTTSARLGLVDQLEYFSKEVSGEDLHGYYLLRRGEFAYNRSASEGYPYGAIKRLDRYDEGVLSTLNICFGLVDESVSSDFLYHAFESGVMNRELGQICQVGSRAHGLLNVTKSDFLTLPVALPPREDQDSVGTALAVADREIEALVQLGGAYARQKDALMTALLSPGGGDL